MHITPKLRNLALVQVKDSIVFSAFGYKISVPSNKSPQYLDLDNEKGIFFVHEYAIMEEFSCSVADQKVSDALQIAIRGKGAFRRFKDVCQRFGMLDQWYSFKTEALKEIAVSWCQENNLEYEV